MSTAFTCGQWAGRAPRPAEMSVFDNPPIVFDAATNTWTETHGCVFRQVFQDYPALEPFYTAFEKNFHALPFVNASERYWPWAFAICGVYLAFCYFGKRAMAGAKPFGLQTSLIAWNAGLSLFSLIGFLRTAPHLLHTIATDGFYTSVCRPAEPSFGHGAAGLWTMLFIFSKIPELGDTVFVVLRKKPLIFLHWYHHVTVLLYCWHSYASRSSAGLYFVVMNYGVHALMYFYYTLTAMRIHPPWAPLVTTLQISQMFVGIAICAAVYVFQSRGQPCDITPENFGAGLLMYASYAALFVVFALERYIWPKPSKAAAAAGKAAAAPAAGGVPANLRLVNAPGVAAPAPAPAAATSAAAAADADGPASSVSAASVSDDAAGADGSSGPRRTTRQRRKA